MTGRPSFCRFCVTLLMLMARMTFLPAVYYSANSFCSSMILLTMSYLLLSGRWTRVVSALPAFTSLICCTCFAWFSTFFLNLEPV